MKGKHQLTRHIEINATPEEVWSVVADSSLLPEWAPPVQGISEISDGPEGVGTTRVCEVNFAGRPGRMTERCVEFEPPRRAGYVVAEDDLGFGKMFADYGFTVTIEEGASGSSIARTNTYYTPRNPLYGLMNALMMRRQFASTVDGLLAGLKSSSEKRAVPTEPRPT